MRDMGDPHKDTRSRDGQKSLKVYAPNYSKQISTKNLPADVEKGIMIFGPLDL